MIRTILGIFILAGAAGYGDIHPAVSAIEILPMLMSGTILTLWGFRSMTIVAKNSR